MLLPVRFRALKRAITGGKMIAVAKLENPEPPFFITCKANNTAPSMTDAYTKNSLNLIFVVSVCLFTGSSISDFPPETVRFI